ncbi:MAG: hypothetical protein K2Q26_07765 [Bdellovibrionales bacterium]|nr:hypothetical protein [Bdellovibrionales bacterium]
MKIFLIVILILHTTSALSDNCGTVGDDLKKDVQEAHSTFKKSKKDFMEAKHSFDKKIAEMISVSEKYPECQKKHHAIGKQVQTQLSEMLDYLNATLPEIVSYDDWFTLVNTKIKNGKKYAFIACVYGPRNATSVNCGLPGTTAKRIFYSTDDMRSIDAKKRWINSIEQKMCVEAYVTAGQAFIVDVAPESKCSN